LYISSFEEDTMSDVSLCIRCDRKTKEQVKAICSELGIGLSSAVNIFFRRFIAHNGFPFRVTNNEADDYNAETKAALKEAEALAKAPNAKRYNSFSEILAEIEAEDGADE